MITTTFSRSRRVALHLRACALAGIALALSAGGAPRAQQTPPADLPALPGLPEPLNAAPPPPPAPAPSANAEKAIVVGDIQFKGLVSRSADDLLGRLATKVGEPYNSLLIREDIGRLAELMRRVAVRTEPMEGDKARIIFEVEEFTRLRQLKAVGNVQLTTERIEEIANLKPGDTLDERTLKSLRKALLEEYNKIGLAGAKVDVNLVAVPKPDGAPAGGAAAQSDVQVVVQEGQKIQVDDVDFEGNESFSKLRLWTLVRTHGSWLFVKNYYDDQEFERDLGAVRAFYTAHGYFDASVERGDFKAETRGGKMHITPVIRIREGERYGLATVEVRGAKLFSEAELLEPFKSMIGGKFDGQRFSRASQRVSEIYYDAGFLTTDVRTRYDFDPESHSVSAVIDIDEKDRIYVGNVIVERPNYQDKEASSFRKMYDKIAPPISDEAIKREILLRPGDVYSKRKERETARRLDRLGIFTDEKAGSTVKITNEPTANPRIHDALISLEEGPTGNFGFGAGFGDQSGAFGYLFLNERNLFGEARDFRAQIQLGTRNTSGQITYTNRHYKDTENLLSVSAYYNRYLRQGYEENSLGVRAEVVRPVWGDWRRGVRGRAEMVDLKERDGFHAQEDLNQSYPVLTGRLSMENDTRYPFLNPTEGRLIGGAVEAGWGGGPLIKFTGEAEYNWELRENLIFHFNPSFGLIPYPSSSVGLSERLFLGGSNDLRGFEFRGAGRRDSKEEAIGIGGSMKVLARNELLFPVFDPVWGVAFVDAGMLGDGPFSYDIPRLSTGVGMRVRMRQATFALDFAIPVLTGQGDQTQFFHFTFKSQF